MQQHRLIKSSLTFAMLILAAVSFAKSDCRKVIVENKSLKISEKVNLCFLDDKSYFISQNCQNLECKFVDKLKSDRPEHSLDNRAGVTMCKFLGGGVEAITIGGNKGTASRCVFTSDHTSISLNLLESWNGKTFTGPGPSMDFK
jgi:hypothetical protein